MSKAANDARTVWSSSDNGAPKTTMIPSPVNWFTVPPYRCTTEEERSKKSDMSSPPAFRTHRCSDVHRMHDIGEEHRHLLVFRDAGALRDGRAAFVAGFRFEPELGSTSWAGHPRGHLLSVGLSA